MVDNFDSIIKGMRARQERDIARYKTVKSEIIKIEEVIEPPPFAQPPPISNIFAPRNFDQYIGQKKIKDVCTILIDAANIEKRPIPSLLIFGPYGLGKTTLARLIMERHGHPYRFMDATLAAKVKFYSGYLIIDEIHNLPSEDCDQLNTILDQEQVTIIGCTTNPGALPAPFRSRMRLLHLDDYEADDIEQILKNSVKRKKVLTEFKALNNLANRSRFNPRHALQSLAFALEIMVTTHSPKLTNTIVNSALQKLDIDEKGLTSVDRKYLEALSPIKPTGISQLRAVLGTDIETIEREIEPFLLRLGYVERTPRGRMLKQKEDDLETLLGKSIKVLQGVDLL